MTADDRPTLEACVCGEHRDCPDGWHYDADLPCSCTPDCALDQTAAYWRGGTGKNPPPSAYGLTPREER